MMISLKGNKPLFVKDTGLRTVLGNTPRRKPVLAIGLLIVFLGGIFIGRYLVPAVVDRPDQLRFITVNEGKRQLVFPTFWDAWDELHSKFIGEVDDADLFYGAVAGMVKAAGDPYTVFANPLDTKQFEQSIEGHFSGVGIEIGIRGGLITVIAPLNGSPAQLAGVREGDIVIGIDEKTVTPEMSLDEVVSMIRGDQGTAVTLKVIHKDSQESDDITVIRDVIEIESVKVSYEDGIAHLVITSFNGDTSQRFNTEARNIAAARVRGIVLDVRNNPGGFLQTSVEIASRFLPRGALVVSERGTKTTEYKAEGNNLLGNIPLVLLVNQGSASASEILAGALHDHLGVPIVGQKTFGKGSVQEFVKLDDGSSLRVTVAKWHTPNGININEEGIKPTIVAEQNFDTDEDEPYLAAKEELEKIIQQR